jgi:hypothetical protein
MLMSTAAYLFQILRARLNPAALAWLEAKAQLFAQIPLSVSPQSNLDADVFLAFSQAVRQTGKAPLHATAEEKTMAHALIPGWDIGDWTCDVTARALLMASLPDDAHTPRRLLLIHQSADLGEHLALVKALFLAPRCQDAMHIAREALRTNMVSVFTGITTHNPYPALYFDENAFNQMVVKCLFVDVPLRAITGLDQRANATLRQILVDLAHERWAAGRVVSPEMWRCVGPFADALGLAAMERALRSGSPSEVRGAALGLMADPSQLGRALMQNQAPELADLANAVRDGRLTWENYDHV